MLQNFLLHLNSLRTYPYSTLWNLTFYSTHSFVKKNFHDQSDVLINNYNLNLNSREICFGKNKLKLTEKEISSIIYIFKSSSSVKIQELQTKVWGYQSELETHTVETHIYRLRKKILKTFNDDDFIISNKNGYEIKKKK